MMSNRRDFVIVLRDFTGKQVTTCDVAHSDKPGSYDTLDAIFKVPLRDLFHEYPRASTADVYSYPSDVLLAVYTRMQCW